MLADDSTSRTTPTREDNGQSPARRDIDTLHDMWKAHAEHILATTPPGSIAYEHAVLSLHLDQLMSTGGPRPSAWVQPIPEIIDIQVTDDLL
jgi:hypothetical protein